MIRYLIVFIFVMSCGASAESGRMTPDILKIIGGGIAELGDIPYQVILRTLDEPGKELFCGGAIVKVDQVLLVISAAHCFLDYSSPTDWQVIAGIVNYNVIGEEAQVRNVTKIQVHEGHDPATDDNDIALVFVDNPFEITEFVRTVDLPDNPINDKDNQGELKVSGWGDIYGNNTYPAELRMVKLPLVESNHCQRIWSTHPSQKEVVTDRMICGGGVDIKSACHGDSGGPAVRMDGTLIGIVSHGENTCNPKYPTFFTKVSYFIEWINAAVANFKTNNFLAN